MGTPSHMSPEQIAAKPLDGRSDQFSLATVAFQLLTGKEPFWADSVATLLHQILYGQRPSARALNPALPAAVDEVLQRGLEKVPRLRYASCTEFVKSLEKAIPDIPALRSPARNRQSLIETLTIPIEPPKSGAESGRFRRRILPFGAAVCVIAAFALLIYFAGILPSRQTIIAPAPASPESPHVVAEVKPPAPTPISLPQNDPPQNNAPEPPPTEDKAARARRLYEQAIRYRKAQQLAKSIDFFRQAATLGDVRSMVELGEMLTNGADGDTADYSEALQWLRKAAEAGNSAGMVDLGGMYLLGNGVDEDFEAAAQLFRRAANAGNPAAMYDLGTMYENGQGVAEDNEKAQQLYSRAASLGNQEARRRLAELAPSANR